MDKVFENFDEADPTSSGGNPYINGLSVNQVEIRTVKLRESQKSSKVHLIVEYIVRETNRDDIKKDDVEYAWVHDLTNQWFGASNTKQFLAAAMGFDIASDEARALGRDNIEEAIGEGQPLTGVRLTLTTKTKATRDGGDFMMHEWSPAADSE